MKEYLDLGEELKSERAGRAWPQSASAFTLGGFVLKTSKLASMNLEVHTSNHLISTKKCVWRYPKYSQQLALWLMCSMASNNIVMCTYKRKPQRSSLIEKNIIMFMLHFNIRLHLELTCVLHFIPHHCASSFMENLCFLSRYRSNNWSHCIMKAKVPVNCFRSVQTGCLRGKLLECLQE